MKTSKLTIRKVLTFVARTDLFFFSLFWLIYLVVAGTLAQRDTGLYQAQQKYFSTLFFMMGPIPLPGAYLTLGVTFFGLIAKLLVLAKWTRRNLGVNITHIGAVLLLLGGFLTAVFSQEGNLALPENSSLNYVTDYHELEFAVTETTHPDHNRVIAFEEGWMQPGTQLTHPELPFKIEMINFYPNTEVLQRQGPAPEANRGFSKIFNFKPAAMDKEDFKNMAALQFRVSGADQPGSPGLDGIYAVFEHMPVTQNLKLASRQFTFQIRKTQHHLPFTIKLIEFKKESYPATEMARSYSSVVEVIEGDIKQRSLIQMNQPLRYKGYTFYQASFSETPGGKTSVLAVVKNAGALFPYISSLIMCFGLLIHLVSKIPVLIAGKGRKQ